ncbi:outer membrane protein [Nitratireductor sp. ZSWI3]|uniref:outer membrane protein n=1 Tax=Nitratireductor sp. ZSWI3 TaxID=2966359 RepID=UPI0021503188|nr:outer membrane protein [Nitratireductor sp. ZSWI3]MCR4268906.1 porin family protein [Nitratireductor sp. ZSWI3]
MRRLFLAGAIAAAACAPAFAADPAASADAMPYDWSGFYLGVQAGGSWGEVEHRIPDFEQVFGPAPDGDISGWLVGGYAGYYWQMDRIVLGAELGANWRDVDGTTTLQGQMTRTTEQKWDASLVGKVGLPVDNMLFYGLAGVSVTEVESWTNVGIGIPTNASDIVWGWTVGAGAEMAFSDHLRGRLEYRFADYGEADVQCSTCGPTFVEPRTHTVAVGLSYNW